MTMRDSFLWMIASKGFGVDTVERDVRDERGFRVDVCDLDCVLLFFYYV